jgi:glycosyltransferase involved in cell wall biosynthesis
MLLFDDESFVTCAYITLLDRWPDPVGLAYYMGRLKEGRSKLDVVYQIYSSPEARLTAKHVAGLKSAMILAKWTQWLTPFRRKERSRLAAQTESRPDNSAEGAPLSMAAPPDAAAVTFAGMGTALRKGNVNVEAYLMLPAEGIADDGSYTFTRLMKYVWVSRVDLQKVFDLRDPVSRLAYCRWFVVHVQDEYGITPNVFPPDLLNKFAAGGGAIAKKARSLLKAQSKMQPVRAQVKADKPGANLVGYALGEFGMGEFLRVMARSFNTTTTPFCVIAQDVGIHGSGDSSVSHWMVDAPQYDINVFSINADVFPFLPFKLGRSFFSGRYNIGYWAWELSKCPPEFDLALHMVDEVWAISEFAADAFRMRSPIPVYTMPLAVTVPELKREFTKSHYGLPEDKFVFFFTFDSASYLDRKNPVAVVKAFKLAFPNGNEDVHLLLKTMNSSIASGEMWESLQAEIATEPRITVLDKRLTREEVLGLNLACDAFVSLHRAEGFGFCVAEAMAYGKPVVVTNYSGTLDFAMEGTACVVDYRLVPVADKSYLFWKGQVWADPDIGHAASLMQRLVYDAPYRTHIAKAGQDYIKDHFNQTVIGKRYEMRLAEIRKSRARLSPGVGPNHQEH